ncbi:hypothetical protein L7F22_065152 [Adiantum nelumboides]|nr:hypothetical protein [Adiantum nelumboides]
MAVFFPTFYGYHDENARDFMDSLEMTHLMAGRDQEEVKLKAFPLVLKGEARVWYDALAPPSKATWPTLYGAFLNKYGQGNTPENLWKQLLRHRQGSLGDYNTYESKFTNIWERWAASLQSQGGAPNFLKRDKFVEGMFPTLKEKVEAKFSQTFEEAQEIATVKFKKLLYQERKSNCVKEREKVNVPQHTNNAQPRVASDGKAEKYEDNKNTIHFLKWQRHQLERDVLGLQGKLQQEVDLHYALENAFRPEAGGLSGLCNLPAHAKKLVSEVAMLEVAISSLEEQIASLNFQLGYEQRHRQLVEGSLGKLPFQGQEGQTREPHCYQSFSRPTLYCVSPNALPSVESPRFVNIASTRKNTYIHNPVGNFSSPVKQESIQDLFSGVATVPHRDSLVQHAKVGYKNFWKQSGFFSPEKVQTLLVLMY